ncbi:hypothetical protein DFQ29_005852 [Apophysomyces sp. BC1021]|nr:hypothetical protein DFQ29_005852 [Apophysomyces sp. BC1021]
MLRTLKISQARILDVQFPARGIVALLVHKQFREDLNQQLFKEGIKPILNFNPLDPKVIGDPKHAALPDTEKQIIAKDLLLKRITRTALKLSPHVGNSVVRFFSKPNGIYQFPEGTYEKYMANRKAHTAPQVHEMFTHEQDQNAKSSLPKSKESNQESKESKEAETKDPDAMIINE